MRARHLRPHPACAALCALCGAAPLAGAQLAPISALTPQRAMFVLEVEDFDELRDAAEDSGLLELATSEQMQRLVQSYAAAQQGEEAEPVSVQDVLDRLGIDQRDLGWPSGRVGVSGYLPWQPDDLAELFAQGDEAEGPVVLMLADFGEAAGGVRDAIERVVGYGLDEGLLEVDSEQRLGGHETTVLVSREWQRRREAMEAFHEEYAERAERATQRENWDGLWEWYNDNAPTFHDPDDPVGSAVADLFASTERIAYAWVGDELALSNALNPLADALEAGEGGVRDAAAGAPWYLNAFVGLEESSHARLALNADLLVRTFVEGMVFGMQTGAAEFGDGADAGAAAEGTRGVLRALGLDATEGMGVTLELARGGSVAEMGLHVHVPEKRGVFELIAEPQRLEPPGFLTDDAMNFSRLLLDFPAVIDLAGDVVESLPAEQRQMARAQYQQGVVIAEPILRELGPEFYMWEYPADPDAQPAMGPMGVPMGMEQDIMVAVALDDPRPLSDTLTGFGPRIQLAPRDFAGGQIFETDFLPISIGIGNGWLLLGRSERVEDALRLGEGAGRADLPDVERAFEGLDTRAAFVSWTSTRRELNAAYDRMEALPEEAPEGQWWQPTREAWMDDLPERQWLLERLGDVVSIVRSTEDGLTGTYRMLEPAD